jgi:Prolipoprotein diacylglyceryl transferase
LSAIANRLNRRFDRVVGLDIRLAGRLLFSWRVFSLGAFATAGVVWLVLGFARGLPLIALIAVPPVPLAIFSAHRRHILRSRRAARLVFHRHLAASAFVLVPLLAVLGALGWQAIDTATTAILVGLAVGRMGCLRSGCCTGRPCTIGPRYPWLGSEHRRLPVQVLDATACVLLAAVTIAIHALGAAAGTATAVGLGGYFLVRFFLDELRDERAATGRHTEAQKLIAVAAAAAAVWALVAVAAA